MEAKLLAGNPQPAKREPSAIKPLNSQTVSGPMKPHEFRERGWGLGLKGVGAGVKG